MNTRGHNERSFRLDTLAGDARNGLDRVQKSESDAIEGWLAYGAALNEGRSLFPGDREFGEWLRSSNLDKRAGCEVHPGEQQAAMWGAAHSDQLEEARAASNARTLRGLHTKWKEIEAERERERLAEEQRQKAAADKAEADQRAERARTEAAAKAEQEVEAKKAVEQADEEGRAEAEQKAAVAAEERQAAEQAAAEAAAAASQPEEAEEPEAAPDPYGYARLTEEALLDLANGLRADLDDEKADHRKTRAKLKEVNEKLKNRTSDDKDEVIRRLEAEAKNAANAKWKALNDRDAFNRQLHAQKAEVEKLKKQLANQEFTL